MAATRFVRPIRGRMFAGVCAGIADHYGWNVSSVRLAALLLILFASAGIWVYLALWIAIPSGD